MRKIIPPLTAAALVSVIILLDLARPLGAHPFWSQNTLWAGLPIGLLVASFVARTTNPVIRIIVGVCLVALTFAVAKYGQTQFAASYAEDTLAGRLWYFGWIAVGASLAGTLTCLFQALTQKLERA